MSTDDDAHVAEVRRAVATLERFTAVMRERGFDGVASCR